MIMLRLQRKEVTGVCMKSMMKICCVLQICKSDRTNGDEENEVGGDGMTFGEMSNGHKVSAVKPERMSL
jgi:hypothetical protein